MQNNIDIAYNSLIDEEKVKKFNETINSEVEALKEEMEGEFEIMSKTTFTKLFKSEKVKSKIPSKKKRR